MDHPSRYAVYFTPRTTEPLWHFGSSILGYDSVSGESVPFPMDCLSALPNWSVVTEEPRKYGFHATLKAPFQLTAECDQAGLIAAVRRIARAHRRIEGVELALTSIGKFAALVPSRPMPEISTLEALVVTGLEAFRAPLSTTDRARRLASPLSPRQIELLDRYGYPHVLDQFRFHMTLTGPLRDGERDTALLVLNNLCARSSASIDALSVLKQMDRRQPFRVIERVPLG